MRATYYEGLANQNFWTPELLLGRSSVQSAQGPGAEGWEPEAGAEKRHSAAGPSGPDRDVHEGVGRVKMEVEDGADAGRDI